MTNTEELWLKKAEREKAARIEAERLLEKKSLELYETNQKLLSFNRDLERTVSEKTAELQVALEDAKEAITAKNQFLAIFSHEIRTPLNAITGLIQLFKTSNLEVQQTKDLGLMAKSSQALIILVNDILDTAKLEDGKIQLNQEIFNFHDELQTIIELYSTDAKEQNTELELKLINNTPKYITADSLRLRQILSNLISNAIKFTKNGKIIIEVKYEQKGDDGLLLFSINDNGIGIKGEHLEKIFSPFIQADSSHSRKFGGTGLGLTICHKLIGLMDGQISVESELGKGTTFNFYIKTKLPEANYQVSKVDSLNNSGSFNSLKCLIVEDIEVNRMLLSRILKKNHVEADLAYDGIEGFEKCKRNNYDIVFMDIQMPNMNGIQCAKEIRKHLKHQPWIIATTANAFKEDVDACYDAGMNDFISKPINIHTLKTKLSSYLANSKN